jgi:DNA-binding Xre family transcriptional regulator
MYAVMKLKIEAILQKKKISKYRLAQLLDVPTSTVFRYFKAEYDPKLSTLEKVAKALEVKVRDLLDE